MFFLALFTSCGYGYYSCVYGTTTTVTSLQMTDDHPTHVSFHLLSPVDEEVSCLHALNVHLFSIVMPTDLISKDQEGLETEPLGGILPLIHLLLKSQSQQKHPMLRHIRHRLSLQCPFLLLHQLKQIGYKPSFPHARNGQCTTVEGGLVGWRSARYSHFHEHLTLLSSNTKNNGTLSSTSLLPLPCSRYVSLSSSTRISVPTTR